MISRIGPSAIYIDIEPMVISTASVQSSMIVSPVEEAQARAKSTMIDEVKYCLHHAEIRVPSNISTASGEVNVSNLSFGGGGTALYVVPEGMRELQMTSVRRFIF